MSRRRALARLALPAALLAALSAPAPAQETIALPRGGQVVAGSASLSQEGRTLTVSQHSERVIMHWQDFSIGRDASVEFVQPSAAAVALNRVLGGDVSRIAGQLRANGRIYLVNSAGIVFGKHARVDVGQLVSSTLDIADGDFLTGAGHWTGPSGHGPEAGLRPLQTPPPVPLPPQIRNVDDQPWQGHAAAGAPDPELAQLTLDAGANGHLRLGVGPEQVQELLEEGGLVEDEDGLLLTARGANSLAASVVARAAAPRARQLSVQDGRLWLRAAPADATRDETDAAGE